MGKRSVSADSRLLKGVFVVLLTFLTGCALSGKLHESFDESMNWMMHVRGARSSALHRKIFGGDGIDGRVYVNFFQSRVKQVRSEGFLFESCHGALACYLNGDRILLSDGFGRSQLPRVVKASLLIHEARHVEGWDHSPCPKLFLDSLGNPVVSPFQGVSMGGQLACDQTPLGAYGVQIVLLTNLYKNCENCDDHDRIEAKRFAEFLTHLIISSPAKEVLKNDL